MSDMADRIFADAMRSAYHFNAKEEKNGITYISFFRYSGTDEHIADCYDHAYFWRIYGDLLSYDPI